MMDGSDAIADWPVLNALLNASSGATWVSVHHGGGVGIGYSLHAGMVIVADGTSDADEKLERVLTCDPGSASRAMRTPAILRRSPPPNAKASEFRCVRNANADSSYHSGPPRNRGTR